MTWNKYLLITPNAARVRVSFVSISPAGPSSFPKADATRRQLSKANLRSCSKPIIQLIDWYNVPAATRPPASSSWSLTSISFAPAPC